ELEQPLRFTQVLQSVLAQITETDIDLRILDQNPRSVRHQDLSAMTCGADARAAMHANPYIPFASYGRFTGVDSHSHAQLPISGPGMLGQRSLAFCSRLDGILRPPERHEEGIALGVDL